MNQFSAYATPWNRLRKSALRYFICLLERKAGCLQELALGFEGEGRSIRSQCHNARKPEAQALGPFSADADHSVKIETLVNFAFRNEWIEHKG